MRLDCPICKSEFSTNYKNKIYCSKRCSIESQQIKKQKLINKRKQDLMSNDAFYYDSKTDKFYIKSLMPKQRR